MFTTFIAIFFLMYITCIKNKSKYIISLYSNFEQNNNSVIFRTLFYPIFIYLIYYYKKKKYIKLMLLFLIILCQHINSDLYYKSNFNGMGHIIPILCGIYMIYLSKLYGDIISKIIGIFIIYLHINHLYYLYYINNNNIKN